MTTEVAILNKTAVALAADSAVTITSGIRNESKIYNSVNKLFSLSKYHPVGIMIYGNADLMGAPWETIIKIYRDKLGSRCYKRLEEYWENFLFFLENSFFSEEEQANYLETLIFNVFNSIKEKIEQKVNEVITMSNKISSSETKNIIKDTINEWHDKWSNFPEISSINTRSFTREFSRNHKTIIDNAFSSSFDGLPINKKLKIKLEDIAAFIFSRQLFLYPSGVVIAGFGDEEIYPSVLCFSVECVTDNKLKFIKEEQSCASVEKDGASIIPFAQGDIIRTFVQGVDPQLEEFAQEHLQNIFKAYAELITKEIPNIDDSGKEKFRQKLERTNQKILDKYREVMIKYRIDVHLSPILNAVQFLPKDELAAMAEALINITSLRKKISTVPETVGGPIDVAVISKGDGFIWIKRKHYFKPELNHQFFNNYFREMNLGRKESLDP